MAEGIDPAKQAMKAARGHPVTHGARRQSDRYQLLVRDHPTLNGGHLRDRLVTWSI